MFAVIETGGKQYKVAEGSQIKVEKLPLEEGAEVVFDQVLMVAKDDSVQVGTPTVEKAKVKAVVLNHGRGEKVNIIKFKRRKHHMKRQGHRQSFTEIEVKSISDK